MTVEEKIIKLTQLSIEGCDYMMKIKSRRFVQGMSEKDEIELLWEMVQLQSNVLNDIKIHIQRNLK